MTNAATGIAQAYSDSQPLLILSGASPAPTQGKGWGALHELNDQAAVTAGFTAFSAMVRYPEELPELIARAYAVFRGTRPRPVHLSLPRDVLPAPRHGRLAAASLPVSADAGCGGDRGGSRALAQARRPLIFVGGGAVGTGSALAAIAERIGAPVLASNAGKGILPDSHPLSLSCSVLQEASRQGLADADVVLLVGSEVAAGDHFLSKLEIRGDLVRIDIDPTELIAMYSAAVPIQADARAALGALSAALAGRKVRGQRAEGELRVREIRERNAAKLTALEQLHARVWGILRAVLPADTVVMGDATQIVYTGTFAMPMERERCWYYSGNVLRARAGSADGHRRRIGAPQRPVVAVAGDGGLMFTVNELATAAEERLALPVIVWNNDALQAIVEGMDERGIRGSASNLRARTFLAWQRASVATARAGGAAELSRAVAEALTADRPTLIEIREDSPWLRA